jgi:outer membrane protein
MRAKLAPPQPGSAMTTSVRSHLAVISLLAGPALAIAQDKTALPLWELGLFGGAVSQQAYPGSDQQVNRALVLPWFIYRGEYLRADRNNLGLRAFKSSEIELDIGVSGAFGSNANNLRARSNMPDLGTLIEFGPRLTWKLGDAVGGRWRVELPLRGVFDLSDGVAQRGLTFEPELQFDRRTVNGWNYSTSVSVVFANRKLADTFYGVANRYATATRPAYTAESGLIAWRLSASASRALGPDWRLFGFARLQTVGGSANRGSPLVRQTTGASIGMGVAYTWKQSQQRAAE